MEREGIHGEQDHFERDSNSNEAQRPKPELLPGVPLIAADRSQMYNPLVLLTQLRRVEILIAILAIGVRLIPGPRTIDDAYITFRYAQNLLQGEGLVYNPGEHVLGITTPTYALVLAAVALVSGGSRAEFPLLALLINAVLDGVTCWLLPKLGERLGYRSAGIASALVWAIAPWSVTFAIGGLETSLLVALATATFYLHLSHRPVAAAATGAFALLTRPDALLFVGPLAIARGVQLIRAKTRPSARELLAFGLPLAIWLVGSLAYYHSPIPHSVFAKAAAYRLPAEAGLVRLLQHYATPFLGHETLGPGWLRIGIVLNPTLYLLGALAGLRVNREGWPLLAYPWLYLAVFALANPLLFRWYLTPPLPAYFLGIFIGAARISRDVKSPIPLFLFAALALGSTANAWTLSPDHGPARPAPKMAFIKLELLYQEASERLQSQLSEQDVLASADIGALGYYSGARILDLLGLISPEATRYYPAPESMYVVNFAVPPAVVTDLKPDAVVILEVYGRKGLLLDPDFQSSYDLTDQLPTDIYGSEGMLIFSRAESG